MLSLFVQWNGQWYTIFEAEIVVALGLVGSFVAFIGVVAFMTVLFDLPFNRVNSIPDFGGVMQHKTVKFLWEGNENS